ncbi:hypothetical protein [Microbacterium sp. JB110]|uniref:hypothetical protein n=1 Tax=Microbacterium sp. JB110 TaxID=2024477 RepID=UPI00097EAA4F|nr:hypothetical protein [Microbacterium sp. JB110]RCS60686.1 hypothetical protein CIK77_08360 [Microbacterium sp. JB110]SJM44855.1 Archaeal/vacuolar-type H+-ATPase subunit A [Frigoribacterium sp. JB110]
MTIEVSSGSVIAVDPDSLRSAASGVSEASERMREIAGLAQEAAIVIGVAPNVGDGRAMDVQSDAIGAAGRLDLLARHLRDAADAYEFVELRFRWTMITCTALPGAQVAAGARLGPQAAAERDAALDGISTRWQELAETNPAALTQANRHWNAWRAHTGQAATDEWGSAANGLLPPVWTGVSEPDMRDAMGDARGLIAAMGVGVVPMGARLIGKGDPVRVTPVQRSEATQAPATLAEAAKRIPDGDTDARIRVETYELPEGGREHVVYLAGTKGGGPDAWDWGSNLDLYLGRRSASYNAVEQALADAGVREGETVHELGFSQGAMVGARLAAEGDYDVKSLVSFGSPVDVAGADDLLQVSVRHTDDVVPMLADGGNPADGVVVEKDFDPADGIHDIVLPAHRLDAYAETAVEIDASSDPRLDALDELFARLGTAEDVSFVEFSAQRPVKK